MKNVFVTLLLPSMALGLSLGLNAQEDDFSVDAPQGVPTLGLAVGWEFRLGAEDLVFALGEMGGARVGEGWKISVAAGT